MNVAMRRPMTVERFLAWEARQEQRYEFDGFQPVAMAGGTAAHAAIARYAVLQQPHPGATVFALSGDDWNAFTVAGDGAVVILPEIGIEVPLAELYADVDFGEPAVPADA